MTDISDSIEENAQGPKRVRVDGNETEQFDLEDQIAADKHTAQAAANAPRAGGPLISYRARPGSAV